MKFALRTLILFLFFSAFLVYADSVIVRFVFTTEPQTIPPDTISGQITVEARDSEDNPVRGNTVCIQITSSAPTGEFSTNAENWGTEPIRVLALTLGTNQYRRNFYYKDSVSGSHTLTLVAALRPGDSTCPNWSPEGGVEWTTTQEITIGTDNANKDTPTSSTQSGYTTLQTSTASPSGGSAASEPGIKAAITASPTVAFVGVPAEFRANGYDAKGVSLQHARYLWSFGDGSRREGKNILYTYQYPGEYVVVLDVSSGELAASLRAALMAVPAEISISAIGDADNFYIEFKNDSSHEVDLGGWLLYAGDAFFPIPQSTFILPGGKLLFGEAITGLRKPPSDTDIKLLYPNGAVAAQLSISSETAQEAAPSIASAAAPAGQVGTEQSSLVNSGKNKTETTVHVSEDSTPRAALSAQVLDIARESEEKKGTSLMWILALLALVAVSILGFLYVRKNRTLADEFTITEEKDFKRKK